jgi:hypothetical protein
MSAPGRSLALIPEPFKGEGTPVSALAGWLHIVEAAPTLREAAAALRAALPKMRVLPMDAIDLRDEKPALRGTRRTLYLGMSDGHCWAMTTDADAASAVFVVDTPAGGA